MAFMPLASVLSTYRLCDTFIIACACICTHTHINTSCTLILLYTHKFYKEDDIKCSYECTTPKYIINIRSFLHNSRACSTFICILLVLKPACMVPLTSSLCQLLYIMLHIYTLLTKLSSCC